MQRQRIDTTRAIMMQTGEFQQGFEIGLNVGLCGGGCRFKPELPGSEESIVAIIRHLCEIAQEAEWLSEELLRRDSGQRAGWIGLGVLSSKEFNDGQSSKRYD